MESAMEEGWEIVGFLVAVLTLPVGLLAGLFVSLQMAATVFIVGWLLLFPITLLVGNELLPMISDRRAASAERGTEPLEELRERYARGEIGDEEFERRVERLVATEDTEVDGSSPSASDRDTAELRSGPEAEREV